MKKLESKSSLFLSISPNVHEIALFKEELNQPHPYDEGKRTSLQLWHHRGQSVVSFVTVLFCSFFLAWEK